LVVCSGNNSVVTGLFSRVLIVSVKDPTISAVNYC
jgi:hypothetical protein